MSTRSKILIFLSLIGLVALVFALSQGKKDVKVPVVQTEKELPTVELLFPSDVDALRNELIAYGIVEAVEELPLSFELNGTVEHVLAHPGKQLRAGEAIAILENDQVAAQVSQAAAAYDASLNAFESFERGVSREQVEMARSQVRIAMQQLEELWDQDGQVVNGAEVDLSYEIQLQEEALLQSRLNLQNLEKGVERSDLAAQWAQVEQARIGLESLLNTYDGIILRAPFDGELVTLDLTEGQQINPGQSVGLIINKGDVELVSYLSTDEINRISTLNTVRIDNRYFGKVLGISTRVDEQTKKRKVRIQMDALGELTVGEMVRLEIEESKSPYIDLLPLSAIVFDDGARYAYTYSQGELERISVTTGQIRGEYIEVINLPELPIVEVARGLSDGQSVNAQ